MEAMTDSALRPPAGIHAPSVSEKSETSSNRSITRPDTDPSRHHADQF